MPVWLISILISLVTKWVIPAILEWLRRKFPWIPEGPIGEALHTYKAEVDQGIPRKQAKRNLRERLRRVTLNKPKEVEGSV